MQKFNIRESFGSKTWLTALEFEGFNDFSFEKFNLINKYLNIGLEVKMNNQNSCEITDWNTKLDLIIADFNHWV